MTFGPILHSTFRFQPVFETTPMSAHQEGATRAASGVRSQDEVGGSRPQRTCGLRSSIGCAAIDRGDGANLDGVGNSVMVGTTAACSWVSARQTGHCMSAGACSGTSVGLPFRSKVMRRTPSDEQIMIMRDNGPATDCCAIAVPSDVVVTSWTTRLAITSRIIQLPQRCLQLEAMSATCRDTRAMTSGQWC